MKIEKPINWLSKNLFQVDKLGNPISAIIKDYEQEKTAKGINRRLVVDVNGIIYKFDIWGDVVADLVDGFGDDTDFWKDKRIRIMLVMKGDKEIKKVQCMRD